MGLWRISIASEILKIDSNAKFRWAKLRFTGKSCPDEGHEPDEKTAWSRDDVVKLFPFPLRDCHNHHLDGIMSHVSKDSRIKECFASDRSNQESRESQLIWLGLPYVAANIDNDRVDEYDKEDKVEDKLRRRIS